MIDIVGRIVFPASLFGCSDPVIYNGPSPCLIHTGLQCKAAYRKLALQMTVIPLSCLRYFIKTELQSQDLCSAGCTSNMTDTPSPVPAPLPTSNFRSVYQQINKFSQLFSKELSNHILDVNPCWRCKWHSVNNHQLFYRLYLHSVTVWRQVASEKPSQRCSLRSLIRSSSSCCQHHHRGLQSLGSSLWFV